MIHHPHRRHRQPRMLIRPDETSWVPKQDFDHQNLPKDQQPSAS